MSLLAISLIIFISSMTSILFWNNNLLSILISFEMMGLSIYMVMFNIFYLNSLLEMMILLIFLICEAILGLVVFLVKVSYTGENYMETGILIT